METIPLSTERMIHMCQKYPSSSYIYIDGYCDEEGDFWSADNPRAVDEDSIVYHAVKVVGKATGVQRAIIRTLSKPVFKDRQAEILITSIEANINCALKDLERLKEKLANENNNT